MVELIKYGRKKGTATSPKQEKPTEKRESCDNIKRKRAGGMKTKLREIANAVRRKQIRKKIAQKEKMGN